MLQHVERVVDLLDPALNAIENMTLEEARRRVLSGDAASVASIEGSFAIVARDGITVRLARTLDRPMRYFLAKRQEGPALFVADRIDTLQRALAGEGLADQFHPSYTRMVPAHYVVELRLVGCPDPDPTYTRFFTRAREALPPDLDEIGRRYIGAPSPERSTSGCSRIERDGARRADRRRVFRRDRQRRGLPASRITRCVRSGCRRRGSRRSRSTSAAAGTWIRRARSWTRSDLAMFLEEIAADPADLDLDETLRTIEDYKPLDVECAAMGLLLARGIRERYPDWRYLIDGDGGDENLKDYPIEENSELTIRSVVNNLMLYQEGWGVGTIKHSLTYSGGLSRGYVRTYAPGRRYGFDEFSPFTRRASSRWPRASRSPA